MPPKVEAIISQNLKNHKITPKSKIVVAVSGGIDSMCLLHILVNSGFQPIVCHIEHGIRGKTSKKDANFIEDYCQKNNLIFEIKELNLKKIASQKSFETTGRELRYKFFEEIADKHHPKKILLAHHLNDSLETFLINFTRGTGLKGLLGIPSNRNIYLRPMNNLTKQEIKNYVKDKKIKFREDKTNKSTKYTRNAIRLNVIPKLKDINPSLLNSFINTKQILQEAYDFIAEESQKWLKKNLITNKTKARLPLKNFKSLNPALQNQILYDLYQKLENSIISNKLIKDVIELINNEKTGSKKPFGKNEIILSNGKINILNKLTKKIKKIETKKLKKIPTNLKSKTYLYIDADKIEGKLTQRAFKPGDKFKPFGMKGHQKIQDFFINNKIPIFERNEIPLLLNKDKIIAIGNMAISDDFKATNSTKTVIRLSLS
ncbi:tRNA lysidine(34) synthetase TilS [Patescibacteria group bacterium]|nr:tRNA lysidine(34) synthetase TilS [Patescibacteria group bacterium]